MDAALKAKWIEALRSGKYEQTMRTLRKPDSNEYCCLGVLCEVMGHQWVKDESGFYKDSQTVLPDPVLQAHLPPGMPPTLAAMNDNGKSFAEIADYIERNL